MEPSINHQVNHQGESDTPARTAPVYAPVASVSAGERVTERMAALNQKVGPQLRRQLADQVLLITGTTQLAATESMEGDRALYAAHEAAVTLYQLGFKTPEQLLAVEEHWYTADWRGQKQERPTISLLVALAASMCAPPRAQPSGRNGHATHPELPTADNAAALKRLGLTPDPETA